MILFMSRIPLEYSPFTTMYRVGSVNPLRGHDKSPGWRKIRC